MNLDPHLLVFQTVVGQRSFSRAAEILNMTQPAVSLQIQTLEEYYGTKLLERNNKRVTLTEAGQLLSEYASNILRLHQEAKQAIDDLSELTRGRLRIGATLTIGEYVVPKVIAAFIKQYPQVEVSLTIANTDAISEAALNYKLDIGLVEGPVHHSQFTITPFLQDEMVLIVPAEHPLAAKEEITSADLQGETFLLREEGSGTRVVMEEIMQVLGIASSRTFAFGSSQAIKEAVASGIGISFISSWVARPEVQLGLLKPVRIAGTTFQRPLSIVLRNDQFMSRAIREFADLVLHFPYQIPLHE